MHNFNGRALSTQEHKNFTHVYLYLLAGIILLVAVFLFAPQAASVDTALHSSASTQVSMQYDAPL